MVKIASTAALFLPLFQAQAQAAENLQGCVPSGEFVEGFDYFPDKYSPPSIQSYGDDNLDIFGNKFVPHNTTDLLEITYHNTYKIVYNKFQNKSYLLYQCGTEPPQEEVDSGRHHLVLSIPHTGGLAVTETPQIPPIELLGKRQELIAYIGNPLYVSSPCMMHMMDENTIETIFNPDEAFNDTDKALLKAAFLAENPEAIIFGGPLGDADGDRIFSVAASQERTNVATFDWIALFAALFNLEGMSNRISRETQASYDCSSANAATMLQAQTKSRAVRQLADTNDGPTILWAQYFNGYNWSVAECPTWDATYYCEYAKHCGAKILSRPEGVGNNAFGSYWYLNDEELLELGKDADIWIYASKTWDTVYGDKKELMDQFKSVQDKQVFDTQGQGPHSWYEQRLAEYDVVGLDMCEMVGTASESGPAHVRRWFRNIYTEPVGQLEGCRIPEELDQPYIPQGTECKLLIANADSGNEEEGGDSAGTTVRASMGVLAAVAALFALFC